MLLYAPCIERMIVLHFALVINSQSARRIHALATAFRSAGVNRLTLAFAAFDSFISSRRCRYLSDKVQTDTTCSH